MRLPIDIGFVEIENVKINQPGPNGGYDEASLMVSVEQAAFILGIGRTRTFELVMSQTITSVKIGRRRLIVRRSLEEFVQRLVAAQASSSDDR